MADAAGSHLPTTDPPAPGLPGPASRILREQRPQLIGLLLGYVVLTAALVLLLTGPPRDGWEPLWPGLVALAVLGAVTYVGAQGEIRAGPGWIAARRTARWQVVTAETISAVTLRSQSSVSFTLRLVGEGRDHVDFNSRGLDKRLVADAVLPMVDAAVARGARVDQTLAVLLHALGCADHGVRMEVPPATVAFDPERARRYWRWFRVVALAVVAVEMVVTVVLALLRLTSLL